MNMEYKAALVDFDGTLVDSMPWWLELPRDSFESNGVTPPPDLDRRIRTVPMWELAEALPREYPQLLRSGPLEEQWLRRMAENYRERVKLKPGADGLLRLLRERGLRVVILSATGYDLLDEAVRSQGLEGLVDLVLSEAEAGSKHSRSAYDFCGERLGLSLSEMLLVEDAPRNVVTAASLGLGTVGVYDESMAAGLPELQSVSDVYLPDYSDLSPLEKWLQ